MRLERGILEVEVDQSAGCHPPTHLFDPFLQPRREDSAARTVQPASPVSSDERRPCGYGALLQRGVKNDTHRLPVARETV